MGRALPYLWYPLLFAGAIAAFAAMLAAGMNLVLATYMPVLVTALVIVGLELQFPERLDWRPQRSDVVSDTAFMAFVQASRIISNTAMSSAVATSRPLVFSEVATNFRATSR